MRVVGGLTVATSEFALIVSITVLLIYLCINIAGAGPGQYRKIVRNESWRPVGAPRKSGGKCIGTCVRKAKDSMLATKDFNGLQNFKKLKKS